MTGHATAASAASKVERLAAERRSAPRYRCMRECLVRLDEAPEPMDWPGMVYNISAAGIGLALPFPAPIGAVLTIEPRGRRAGMRLRARIVRCGLQKFVWFHGCAFEARLSAEELRLWLSYLRGGRYLGGLEEPPPAADEPSQAT
jgi:hypothetical protein